MAGKYGRGIERSVNSGQLTSATTSASATGLPTNGVKLYARLWSQINGGWQSTDYSYTEAGTPSQGSLMLPTPGSVLTGPDVTFTWTAGSGPTAYELWVGSTGLGSSDLYNSGSLTAITTSASVTGLPTTGAKVYVRLWSRINGLWQSTDYTYLEQ